MSSKCVSSKSKSGPFIKSILKQDTSIDKANEVVLRFTQFVHEDVEAAHGCDDQLCIVLSKVPFRDRPRPIIDEYHRGRTQFYPFMTLASLLSGVGRHVQVPTLIAVTMTRSAIGQNPRTRSALKFLGLGRKIGRTRIHKNIRTIHGQLVAASDCIRIRDVEIVEDPEATKPSVFMNDTHYFIVKPKDFDESKAKMH